MVIIFGASSGGKKILRELIDLQIDFFVDNDSEKWGTMFFGYPVYSPEVIAEQPLKGLKVFVASIFYEEIKKQLESFQLIEGIHFYNGLQIVEERKRFRHCVVRLEQYVDTGVKNIEQELQRRALQETVDFVEQHLMRVPSFPDRYSLLEYALSLAETGGSSWSLVFFKEIALILFHREFLIPFMDSIRLRDCLRIGEMDFLEEPFESINCRG